MGCGNSKAAAEKARQEQEEEERKLKAAQAGGAGRKRGSVSAQGGMDPTKMTVNLNTLPKVAKSEEAIARIKECCAKVILFKTLSAEYLDAIIASMSEHLVNKGDYIITQGEAGDNWYVIDKGAFEAYKKMDDEEAPGKKVKSYGVGDSFGELALMYNQRRAASVIATEDSTVWTVPQSVFKQLILTASMQNKADYS